MSVCFVNTRMTRWFVVCVLSIDLFHPSLCLSSLFPSTLHTHNLFRSRAVRAITSTKTSFCFIVASSRRTRPTALSIRIALALKRVGTKRDHIYVARRDRRPRGALLFWDCVRLLHTFMQSRMRFLCLCSVETELKCSLPWDPNETYVNTWTCSRAFPLSVHPF